MAGEHGEQRADEATDPGRPAPPWPPAAGGHPGAAGPYGHRSPPPGYGPVHYGPPAPRQYGFPPYGPPPTRPRRSPLAIVAAVLLVVAAGLAVGGSFAPFSTYTSNFGEPQTQTTTGWSVVTVPEDPGFSLSSDLAGVFLVVGAVVALLGAVLAVAVRGPVGRAVGTAGAGVLTGAAGTIVVRELADAASFARFLVETPDAATTLVVGPGVWLVLAAGLLAVAAIVLLACVRDAVPRW